MNRKRLLWKVYFSCVFLTILAVSATGWFATRSMRSFFISRIETNLVTETGLMLDAIPSSFPDVAADSLQTICNSLDARTAARVTLIATDGRVLADSRQLASSMVNHSNRPEVRAALSGSKGTEIHFSFTLHEEMIYIALPVTRQGQVWGVLRTAIPLTTVNTALHNLAMSIFGSGLIVVLLAALATWILSKRFSNPISIIVAGAQRYASGDFSQKIYPMDTEELTQLSEALNHMAAELDAKIRTITLQRNQQEAILTSMREGVLAVDRDQRVLFMNRAAEIMLGYDSDSATGRLLQEVVRHSDLQHYIIEIISGNGGISEREISLPSFDHHILQANGGILTDSSGAQMGVLVVLMDITNLRKLESLRKDFVANVSHELKTPITSIKGYVETLAEGALEDKENAQLFLGKILHNTERLNSIIDDLLSLSKIERDLEQADIPMTVGSTRDVVLAAIATCADKAASRSIRIDFQPGKDVNASINATLLEQAVINLLNNAIKYSEPDQVVTVDLTGNESEVAIRVQDHGCGIPAEHIPRLFERFYRVDLARSRRLGGTGLGLAITKHIVQAHHGRVDVKSTVGSGSEFTIVLPTTI